MLLAVQLTLPVLFLARPKKRHFPNVSASQVCARGGDGCCAGERRFRGLPAAGVAFVAFVAFVRVHVPCQSVRFCAPCGLCSRLLSLAPAICCLFFFVVVVAEPACTVPRQINVRDASSCSLVFLCWFDGVLLRPLLIEPVLARITVSSPCRPCFGDLADLSASYRLIV